MFSYVCACMCVYVCARPVVEFVADHKDLRDVHIYIYIFMHTKIHIYVYMYAFKNTYINVRICIHTYEYIHANICI